MSSSAPMHAPAAEQFVVFECAGHACISVLAALPQGDTPPEIGVVIAVGGPQYRVGSHRQFVSLSRALAFAGIPALRFDYRGMGDSEGDPRTFEHVDDDIGAAIDALQRATGVRHIVLWGLCDAASAILMYAADDPRISGVIAVNPWVRTPTVAAVTLLKHYYLRRLFSRSFWRKVVTGKFAMRRSGDDLLRTIRNRADPSNATSAPAYLDRMERGSARFQRPMLFILSGNDLTAREFEEWVGRDSRRAALFRGQQAEVCRIPDADHTFSRRASGVALSSRTVEWIAGLVR